MLNQVLKSSSSLGPNFSALPFATARAQPLAKMLHVLLKTNKSIPTQDPFLFLFLFLS